MLSFLNLHLLSLTAGIAAWLFGCWAIASKKNRNTRIFSVASLSLCSIALVSQLIEIGRLVEKNDLSAVMDTIRAVNIAAVVLTVITVVLNVMAFIRNK